MGPWSPSTFCATFCSGRICFWGALGPREARRSARRPLPLRWTLRASLRPLLNCTFATGSLARVLEGPHRSDDWVVVDPAVDPHPPKGSSVPNPAPLSSASASPVPKFRFRPPPASASRPLSFEDCVHLCSSLGTSVREARASRAWAAGRSAALVLSGQCDYVDASPKIEVRSRLYVVLRHSSGKAPATYRSFASFKRAVGHLPGSTTVCHGFPTEGEARVFCAAAGCPYPPEEQ